MKTPDLINWEDFNEDYQDKAKRLVVDYFNARVKDEIVGPIISADNVYVVWFSKTLQNWKALLSTTIDDGVYYELTYNGADGVTYLDAYVKVENVCVVD
ncbi:MAG: hypothetical protein JJE28_08740 [Actinomycetales bacterium]|nr:hypothetical protein [Actinomycetales bacterium]